MSYQTLFNALFGEMSIVGPRPLQVKYESDLHFLENIKKAEHSD